MTALISLKSCFEDRPLTTLELDGRSCWIAREVGRAIGYEQEGRRFVTQITDRWADELIEGVDYRSVQGEELQAIKELLGTFDDTGSVSSNWVHDTGSVSTKAGVAPELDTAGRFDDPGSVPSKLNHQLLSLHQAVADVVLGQVTGLAAFLDRLPAGQHEHVTDAAGHALLGLREMAEMRRMMGVAVP